MIRIFSQLSLILFLFSSCHVAQMASQQDVLIVDCIRKKTNFDLTKEGLVRIGLGQAYNPDSGTIRESYHTRKLRFTNNAEAKAFFSKIFDQYIEPINADKRLASLSKGYPFTKENTEIEITFIDTKGSPLSEPHIARIKNSGDSLIIYSYDQERRQFIHKEIIQ